MKKVIFIIISCVLFLSGVLCSNVFERHFEKDVVMQKQTAIKVGRAVLEEHFNISSEEELDAIEKDGKWIVYNVVNRDVDENIVVLGGGIYVEISKNNGEILKIGVAD